MLWKKYFKTLSEGEEDILDQIFKFESFCEYFEMFVTSSRNNKKEQTGEKEVLNMYEYGGYFRLLVAEYDKVVNIQKM